MHVPSLFGLVVQPCGTCRTQKRRHCTLIIGPLVTGSTRRRRVSFPTLQQLGFRFFSVEVACDIEGSWVGNVQCCHDKDPIIITPQRGNKQFTVENAVLLLHRILGSIVINSGAAVISHGSIAFTIPHVNSESLLEDFKHALVWGSSVKQSPQAWLL